MDKEMWVGIGGIIVALLVLAGLATVVHPPSSSYTEAQSTTTAVAATSSINAGHTSLDNQRDEHTSYELPLENTGLKTVEVDGEMVSVTDQVAGQTVTVHDVHVNKPSWVAVKDVGGWVLGAAWVATDKETVEISLLRSTEKGKSYQTVLFVDNGNKKFEMYEDRLVVFDGAPVGLTFSARRLC